MGRRRKPFEPLAIKAESPLPDRRAVGVKSGSGRFVEKSKAPRVGLEQSEDSPRRVQVSETGAAKSAALGDDLPSIDPDLASVIDAWHSLPSDTRTAILAIVEAAHGR
ncbi:MAG TPA: hypothetical protein DCE55_03470 [Planctomycetaceae bacterium]|nr:hypothetical protein [Planctomycetaceae bacterium]